MWLCLSLVSALALGRRMTDSKAPREVFLPGETTHGHYQIELSCGSCHTEEFGLSQDFQSACVECHAEELEVAQDSHPESKFTDPRNADRVEKLDARYCVTCHSEHQPERTGTMGLSLPEDYCYYCHDDIGEDRESHIGLTFDSCANAGCHNFHDNRALYEDYLVRHAQEPVISAQPLRPLAASQKSCPSPARAFLSEKTSHEECRQCHGRETSTWLGGRHGMRLAADLSPMQPQNARLPMKKESGHQNLSCASCHAGSKEQTLKSGAYLQVEACLSCHDDEHSLAYKKSKHYQFYQQELEGRIASGSGATCASCHLPRTEDDDGALWVNHNQNDNLRPNEKMIRSVCMNCHGLPFSIDALADDELCKNNFLGQPKVHVESVDFAVARE